MLVLYRAGGSGSFSMQEDSLTPEQFHTLKHNVSQMLRERNRKQALGLLEVIPFEIKDAQNDWGDEFSVLYAETPLFQYEQLRKMQDDAASQEAFAQLAHTISEIGPYIRFIAVDLLMENPENLPEGSEMKDSNTSRLTGLEIHKLVNKYIGVEGGYLGDFSYNAHYEFYMQLDLQINPNDYPGTTRQRFIKILSESSTPVQAKILEGILYRYPVGSSALRTPEMYNEILSWISRLKGTPVPLPPLKVTSPVVERALSDAEKLLKSSGAISALDRIHTAFHGFLEALCNDRGIPFRADCSLTELFKLLRQKHPAFIISGPRADEINRIIRTMANILDSLNTLRNQASVAHPNEELLLEPEAMLVINGTKTLLHYINDKIARQVGSE
ncbi:MAG: abortive infection family protein [Deltaproteobacteria bacterium]|nr:abortive infection family protein [Deltaproteobacteria bacterium]